MFPNPFKSQPAAFTGLTLMAAIAAGFVERDENGNLRLTPAGEQAAAEMKLSAPIPGTFFLPVMC